MTPLYSYYNVYFNSLQAQNMVHYIDAKKRENMKLSVTTYSDKKFKNVVMSLHLFIPFKKLDNTKLALLAQLCDDRNEKYLTKSDMLKKLDNMYGANLSVRTLGFGQYQSLEFRLSSIHEQYVQDNFIEEEFAFLSDIVYQPLLSEETLREAKQNLKDKLLRQVEKPNSYAMNQALSIGGQSSSLAISANGSLEEIDEITLEDINDFHKEVIQHAMAHLFVVGDVKQDEVEIWTSRYFREHRPLDVSEFAYFLESNSLEDVTETKPIQQASLVMMYTSNRNVKHPLYYAYRVGVAILGQLPTSYLFQEVREKNSLCYSVHASSINFDGVLYMNTQLAAKNLGKAQDLMALQLNRIITGDIESSLLDGAKLMLKNTLLSVGESEYSTLSYGVQSKLIGRVFDIDKAIDAYETVTISDIVEAFKDVTPLLMYQLKGEDHDYQ